MNSSRGRVAIALVVLALLVILGWLLQPGQRDEHAAAPGAAPSHPVAVARSAGPAASAIVVLRG